MLADPDTLSSPDRGDPHSLAGPFREDAQPAWAVTPGSGHFRRCGRPGGATAKSELSSSRHGSRSGAPDGRRSTLDRAADSPRVTSSRSLGRARGRRPRPNASIPWSASRSLRSSSSAPAAPIASIRGPHRAVPFLVLDVDRAARTAATSTRRHAHFARRSADTPPTGRPSWRYGQRSAARTRAPRRRAATRTLSGLVEIDGSDTCGSPPPGARSSLAGHRRGRRNGRRTAAPGSTGILGRANRRRRGGGVDLDPALSRVSRRQACHGVSPSAYSAPRDGQCRFYVGFRTSRRPRSSNNSAPAKTGERGTCHVDR